MKTRKQDMTAREIIETQKNEVAVLDYTQFAGSGVSADVDETDLILPQMQLMQGLSNMVAEGDAKSGEVRDSLNGELLGDKNGPPKVLIFGVRKTWEVSTKGAGQKKDKWKESIPVTVSNALLPKEESDGHGGLIIRHLQYNFTCLYTGREFIQKETPYIVSMRSYSVRPAQKLCSHFTRLEARNRPSYSQVIELIPTEKENDLGKFYAWDWTSGRDATMEEMQACYAWRNRLKNINVTIKTAEPSPVTGATVARDDEGMQF